MSYETPHCFKNANAPAPAMCVCLGARADAPAHAPADAFASPLEHAMYACLDAHALINFRCHPSMHAATLPMTPLPMTPPPTSQQVTIKVGDPRSESRTKPISLFFNTT